MEKKTNTCATAYAHNIICSTDWTDQLVLGLVVVVVVDAVVVVVVVVVVAVVVVVFVLSYPSKSR